MHVIFIPYGKRTEVERLIRDMEAQKFILRMKKGEDVQAIYIEGAIRLLPFGIYEYIFPKEDMDCVLTTLGFDNIPYDQGKIKSFILREIAQAEKIPKFKKDKKLLWVRKHVGIMPIGVRYDGEVTEPEGSDFPGYVHEAI